MDLLTVSEKICRDCGLPKPLADFYSVGAYTEPSCKSCKGERVSAYRKANPDKCRGWVRKSRYNVSSEQYSHMLALQEGVCAVCAQPEVRETNGTVWHLSVDHDHLTGRVRGLICDACNKVLGLVQDNPSRLEAAMDYLARFNF